jgi:hypothetical protein
MNSICTSDIALPSGPIDNELFQIFQHCVGAAEQSAIIFYRAPGLDVRLSLTDEVVTFLYQKRPKKSGAHDPPQLKKRAIENFRNLLAVRRRIAIIQLGFASHHRRISFSATHTAAFMV